MQHQLAPGRHPSGQREHQPAERVDIVFALLIGQHGTNQLLEVLDRRPGIRNQRSVAAQHQLRVFGHVVLILDLADDLFDQVLDRDQTVDAAEFVDHQRHVHPRLTHLEKQIQDRHRGCDEQSLAQSRGEVEIALAADIGHQVLDVDETQGIVQGVAVDGHARVSGLAHGLHQGLQVRAHVDCDDVGAWHHDVVSRLVTLSEDVGEHRLFILADPAVGFVLAFAFADLFDDLFQRMAQARVRALEPEQLPQPLPEPRDAPATAVSLAAVVSHRAQHRSLSAGFAHDGSAFGGARPYGSSIPRLARIATSSVSILSACGALS